MITRDDIVQLSKNYDRREITIGTIGSHSALEIMDGAKDENFKTVCICQKGRQKPYEKFKRLVDEIILVDRFSDIIFKENQEKLRNLNTILVANRSFTAYLGYDMIENELRIPIFGNRTLLRAEERSSKRNQYYLLEKAGITHPKIYSDPSEIDNLAMVKIQEAKRKLERAFFLVSSKSDYEEKVRNKLKIGTIAQDELPNSIIEEYVLGTYFNFNFFISPLTEEVEFLGIERRLQTNLHDTTTSLTAKQQLETDLELQNIEIGHTPASIRESMLEKVFEIGEKFANTAKIEYPPGIIGPLSLQSVVNTDLEIIVYDVSLRVPGNPIMATTSPYTKYYYGHTLGVGRRIAMEVRDSLRTQRLDKLLT